MPHHIKPCHTPHLAGHQALARVLRAVRRVLLPPTWADALVLAVAAAALWMGTPLLVAAAGAAAEPAAAAADWLRGVLGGAGAAATGSAGGGSAAVVLEGSSSSLSEDGQEGVLGRQWVVAARALAGAMQGLPVPDPAAVLLLQALPLSVLGLAASSSMEGQGGQGHAPVHTLVCEAAMLLVRLRALSALLGWAGKALAGAL